MKKKKRKEKVKYFARIECDYKHHEAVKLDYWVDFYFIKFAMLVFTTDIFFKHLTKIPI